MSLDIIVETVTVRPGVNTNGLDKEDTVIVQHPHDAEKLAIDNVHEVEMAYQYPDLRDTVVRFTQQSYGVSEAELPEEINLQPVMVNDWFWKTLQQALQNQKEEVDIIKKYANNGLDSYDKSVLASYEYNCEWIDELKDAIIEAHKHQQCVAIKLWF